MGPADTSFQLPQCFAHFCANSNARKNFHCVNSDFSVPFSRSECQCRSGQHLGKAASQPKLKINEKNSACRVKKGYLSSLAVQSAWLSKKPAAPLFVPVKWLCKTVSVAKQKTRTAKLRDLNNTALLLRALKVT